MSTSARATALSCRASHPDHEVEEKTGWHWTTYAAEVQVPFEAQGTDLDATLRYARVFGEEAVVDVSIGSVPTERFKARGGEVRSTTLKAAGVAGEVRMGITVDSHERRNMGLRMDRLRLDVSAGPPLKLQRRAAARPVAAIVLLFAGLLAVGASPLLAGGLSLVGALLFLARASEDLFGAYRQVSLAPGMLIVSSIVLRAAKRWVEPHVGRKEAAWLAAAGLVDYGVSSLV